MGSKKADDICDACGTNMLLYKCKYCGKIYCEEHRRPEAHNCSGLSEYRYQLETGTLEKPGMQTVAPNESRAGGISISNLLRHIWHVSKIVSIALISISIIIALVMLVSFIVVQLSATPSSIPVQNTTGVQVVLVNNLSASDPTYDDLIRFLKSDSTSSAKYVYPDWTCADFARQLHDNAEAHGIKAAFVAVEFYNSSIDYSIYDDGSGSFSPPLTAPDMGHGFNLFNTTDRGQIYVDASGIYESSTGDRIVYVAEGREFNEIDLDYAQGTDYAFYSGYRQKYIDYVYDLKEYNRLASAYNQGIAPVGMDLKQASLQLKSKRDDLTSQKAALGPFYYPPGVVKQIDVYW